MDIAGTASAITQLRGAVKRLNQDDNDIVDLIIFVCETLCNADPKLRSALIKAADQRIRADFPTNERGMEPRQVEKEKLRYGLRQISKKATDSP